MTELLTEAVRMGFHRHLDQPAERPCSGEDPSAPQSTGPGPYLQNGRHLRRRIRRGHTVFLLDF